MIQKLEVAGLHLKIDEKLQLYVSKKIGRLDKYMSKHSRKSVHVEVKLKETKAKDKKQSMCEVVMYLPHESITAKEATINMYAAIDIVETKLKNSLKKYKDLHEKPYRVHRRFIARLRRA